MYHKKTWKILPILMTANLLLKKLKSDFVSNKTRYDLGCFTTRDFKFTQEQKRKKCIPT